MLTNFIMQSALKVALCGMVLLTLTSPVLGSCGGKPLNTRHSGVLKKNRDVPFRANQIVKRKYPSEGKSTEWVKITRVNGNLIYAKKAGSCAGKTSIYMPSELIPHRFYADRGYVDPGRFSENPRDACGALRTREPSKNGIVHEFVDGTYGMAYYKVQQEKDNHKNQTNPRIEAVKRAKNEVKEREEEIREKRYKPQKKKFKINVGERGKYVKRIDKMQTRTRKAAKAERASRRHPWSTPRAFTRKRVPNIDERLRSAPGAYDGYVEIDHIKKPEEKHHRNDSIDLGSRITEEPNMDEKLTTRLLEAAKLETQFPEAEGWRSLSH